MQPESRRKRGRAWGGIPAALVLVLITSVTSAEIRSDRNGPADLVPSSAIMYMQTSRLSSAAPAAVFFIGNFLPAENAKKIEAWRADFKTKAGVDVLDVASLTKAEIDVSRPAAMAYLDAEKESERIMILVPVNNEKTFPQRFVEVLKKANKDRPAIDLHPAVSRHNNHAVYRMMKDVYFTGIKGYLVVASSMDIITSVIDMGATPLSAEPLFADYAARKRAGNDLDIFFKKSFLQQIGEERLKKKEDDSGDSPEGDGDGTPEDDSGEIGGPSTSDKKAQKRVPGAKDALSMVSSPTGFFDYVAVAFARTKEGVSLDFSASLTGGNQSTALLSGLFRPGLPAFLLAASDPLAYHYVSFDFRALDAFCEKNASSPEYGPTCEQYKKFKKDAGSSLGIDMDADFLPWFGGYFNVIMRKAKIAGTLDNFVMYVPMTDRGKVSALTKKLRSAVKAKNTDEGAFGDERIDAIPSFWFKDKRGNRISVLADERGVFVANNTEFLRAVLEGEGKQAATVSGLFGNPDPGTFLLSFLKMEKESYMKALLMFLTYNAGPHVAGLVNRLDTVSLSGGRVGNYYSFIVTLKLLEAAGR
ncbi:MAG TPA: hypothetical protein VLM75_11105 [Spirochaetota bacterium]|nr:hypothetical protein [Spirochaetota bacterium]